MDESFRDRLAREVPGWVDDGLVSDAQAQRILERYEGEDTGGAIASGDWVSSLLYGTAAVLLGAAAIALVFVGIDPDPKAPPLFAIGGVMALAGLALHLVKPERDLLVDALLAAALAPLAVGTFDPDVSTGGAVGFGVVAAATPVAYLLWRRGQPFLPTLSVIGFTAAAGGTTFEVVANDADAALVWMLIQAAFLAVLVGIDRVLRGEDAPTPIALGTLAMAGSVVPFLFETVDLSSSETGELILGGVLLAVLGAGVGLRHRGLVLGAAVGVGIDAIVFAFDVGGVALGTGLLVGLAALLIWQAESLRGWIAETG